MTKIDLFKIREYSKEKKFFIAVGLILISSMVMVESLVWMIFSPKKIPEEEIAELEYNENLFFWVDTIQCNPLIANFACELH